MSYATDLAQCPEELKKKKKSVFNKKNKAVFQKKPLLISLNSISAFPPAPPIM